MLSTPRASILGFMLTGALLVIADSQALWLEPSTQWYGIDGNWSAMGLLVGEPAQQVDVTVSTCLSEIWVVESSGCGSSSLCTAARGDVYNVSASSSWSSLGAWQLGLDYLGLGGNGDYAMETVVVYDSVTRWQTTLQKQIVAGINTTDYFTGFFGLGITPGKFSTTVELSPIASLVEKDGVIPSHSYGYTAGAYYGGSWGTPMSLTLGGYDANRFVDHATTFSLNSTSRLPEVLVRGITATVPIVAEAPTEWKSTSAALMHFNESVTAIIDSSTPYLWLPTVVCDRFADAFNLTWNETFGLYLFAEDAIYQSFSKSDLSFTFSLSSMDNTDNFGEPLAVAGVVNITLSANAFAQSLRYPFMDLIEYGAPAIPYFPLRRADNDTMWILGRSFLQEAYLKMNYETTTFSVHQAVFPDNPLHNTSIITVATANGSPYPGVAATANVKHGLSTPSIVGIVIGVFMIAASIISTTWYIRRRRRMQKQQQQRAMSETSEIKDGDSTMDEDSPRTPVARMFSRLTRRLPGRRSKKGHAHEMAGDSAQAVEAAGNERHELEVPPAPVELDATDSHSINGTTEFGTDEAAEMSSYELARRKMERQLQGPVPEYTPAQSPVESPVVGAFEKGVQDISRTPHYRASNRSLNQASTLTSNPSPVSTPTSANQPYSLPSPISPYGEWPNMDQDLPPSATLAPQSTFSRSISNPGSGYTYPSSHDYEDRSLSRSASSSGSPISQPTGSMIPQQPPIQRTPIDPSKIVCLGPLPSNMRFPHHSPIPRIVAPDGPDYPLPAITSRQGSRRASAADTLGSNYTDEEGEGEEEEANTEDIQRQSFMRYSPLQEEPEPQSAVSSGTLDGPFDLVHIPLPAAPASAAENTGRLDNRADLVHVPQYVDQGAVNASLRGRLRDGMDLVHVPQPAEKRYSWEQ